MKKTMKKILCTFLVVIMCLTASPLQGFVGLEWTKLTEIDFGEWFSSKASAATEGYYTYTVTDGKATITNVSALISGDITIPGTLGGYTVTTIGGGAFYLCNKVTSITITESVKTIEGGAFKGCGNLTNVTIPNSVTSIGSYAFDGTSLESITIPNSVTRIVNFAFSGCRSLASITIPNSVTSIGSYAFECCTSLVSIIIPDSVTSIESDAFYYCTSLLNIRIGNGVTNIGSRAFSYCTSLKSITIPNSVTNIDGSSVFKNCSSLTSIIVDKNNKYYSNDEYGVLFRIYDINRTRLVCYPEGNDRTSYTVPNNVAIIEDDAFNKCKNLIEIVIPNSVLSIGGGAFSYCTNLTDITIPDSVDRIDTYAFWGCDSLKSVTIGNGVTHIGESAFWDCTSLTSIIIPVSVTSIGRNAFRDCVSLIRITVDKNNNTYSSDEHGVLFNKNKTELIFYPSGNKINTYTIPNTVTKIGYNAFYNCDNLVNVNIPNSVTSIGENAFWQCTGLRNIHIPDGVMSMGESAFYDCDNLTSVTIGNSLTSIVRNVFRNCDSLTAVTIGNNVTSIDVQAFSDCGSLITVVIPDSVTRIESYAFDSCYKLTYVYYIGTEEQWKTISIGSNNSKLLNAIMHYNSTGPDKIVAIEFANNVYEVVSGEEFTISGNAICSDSVGELDLMWSCKNSEELRFEEKGSVLSIDKNEIMFSNTVTAMKPGTYYIVLTDENTGCSEKVKIIARSDIKEYYGILESVGWSIPYNGEKYISQITVDGDTYAVKKGVLNNSFESNVDKYISFVTKNDEVIKVNLIEVHTGKLEKNSLVIILNGDESYYEILVDGKTYRVSDSVNPDEVDEIVGRNAVFVTEDNRVVWIEAEMNLKPYVSAYINPNDLRDQHEGVLYSALRNYNFVYNGKNADIKYTNHMRPIYINIYNGLDTKLFEGAPDYCADAMELLYQYNVNISEITLTTSDKKIVAFNDDEILMVTGINNAIKSGETYVVDTGKKLKVNPDYKMKEKNETYYVYCNIKGTVNGRTFTNQTTEEINLIDNGKYLIVNNNSNNNTNNNDTNSSDNINYQINNLAQKAAEELSAISGEIALHGIKANVPDLFTDAQLDAVGDMLLCEVAMAVAPEDTYKEALSKKIIDKIFSIDTNFFGVKSGEVSVTVAVDSKKYGNVKVKFICEFSGYLLSGSPFAYMGNIDYEIVGGKGESKINKKSGFAGALSGVDMESFCNVAYDVALSEIKSGYNKAWGDNANAAADIIFNKTVKDILKYTKKSVSGIYWDIITTPAKTIKIECPVDVFVYDEDGTLVASVENNKITLDSTDVEISVNGDKKYIKVYNQFYKIVYKAYSGGSLRVTVEECGGLDSVVRTTVIDNIPLKAGAKFMQDIDNTLLEESDYSIVGQNEIYDHNSDNLVFHEHVYNDDWCIGEEATCINNGWTWTNCTVCGETVKNESLAKLPHNYNSVVTKATCENGGYTTYICDCGDTYTETIPATGHTFNGSKCTSCGYDKADECDCNCHASGIKKFFFNFILFFQKLFKKNAVCDCGMAHY